MSSLCLFRRSLACDASIFKSTALWHRQPPTAAQQELSRLGWVSHSQDSQRLGGNSGHESDIAVRVVRPPQWYMHLVAEQADPTGTVCAMIGHAILAKLESVLSIGSVLVLRNEPLVPFPNMFPVYFTRQHPVGMFRLVIPLEHVEQVFPPETSISVCVPGGVRLCARSKSASYSRARLYLRPFRVSNYILTNAYL